MFGGDICFLVIFMYALVEESRGYKISLISVLAISLMLDNWYLFAAAAAWCLYDLRSFIKDHDPSGDPEKNNRVESRPEWNSISAVLGCHGDAQILRVPGVETAERSLISMEGTKVFKFAVETVPRCMDQVLAKAGMTAADVDFFVFHQANARIIDLAVRKYHIPPEKYYKNIQKYGNTSAASIPLVISELHDLGKVGPGSRVLVVGFGGGLTWGGALVEFA